VAVFQDAASAGVGLTVDNTEALMTMTMILVRCINGTTFSIKVLI